MLATLLKNWKLELALVLLAGCFMAGRMSVRTSTDTTKTTDDTTQTDKKQIDDQKVTTITKGKDGTTTTTITEHTKTDETDDTKKHDTSVDTKTAGADPYMPNWGIGGGATANWDHPADKPGYYVKAARRVLGNAWVEGQVSPSTHEVSAGIRIDF